jgi:hypothetical protein
MGVPALLIAPAYFIEGTVSLEVVKISEDRQSFEGIMKYKEAGIKYEDEMSGKR